MDCLVTAQTMDHVKQSLARWRPEEACRPLVAEAPVFYPTEEEFKDAVKYLEAISREAKSFGICRIVPPSSFQPLCVLKEKHLWEDSKFGTRLQEINKLQNRNPARKSKRNSNRRRKKGHSWTMMSRRQKHFVRSQVGGRSVSDEDERFGFFPGPEYTLEAFQKYADKFKEQYFGVKDNCKNTSCNNDRHSLNELSVEDIEGEYWRLVEKASEEVEVLYGADLDTSKFSSGFPKAAESCDGNPGEYVTSGWNLNNFARLPGSVLSFEEDDISGVLVPWLYVGMCFSSFCWHVEDHNLYSLNYLHMGDPKLWYGVPQNDALKLENAMKKHLPHLFEGHPGLLHELVTQLSPTVLKSEGVSVYRAIQNAGEFVVTFPRAYHSGFNCGFNCAEAVNIAPFDWLPHGQSAVELYHEQHRKTSISHDKLLLRAANEAIKVMWEQSIFKKANKQNCSWKTACGKDGILTNAIKTRVLMERKRRELLPETFAGMRMHRDFGLSDEKECFLCFYDLVLSATGCFECSPKRFSCLVHAKLLCSCDPSKRYFLFRYDLDELDTLVNAVEGNLSALCNWASVKLGIVDSSLREPGDSCCSKQVASVFSDFNDSEGINANLASMSPQPSTKRNQVGCDGDNDISDAVKKGPVGTNLGSSGVFSEKDNDRDCTGAKSPCGKGALRNFEGVEYNVLINAIGKSVNTATEDTESIETRLEMDGLISSVAKKQVYIDTSFEKSSAAECKTGLVKQESSFENQSSLENDNSVSAKGKVDTQKRIGDVHTGGPAWKQKRCS